jgi:hypothetical protein
MQRQLEPIDVENKEYEAWDEEVRALELFVTESKSEWLGLRPTGTVVQ